MEDRQIIRNINRRLKAIGLVDANCDPIGGSGGGAVWGSITGTLGDQTDLQAALDAILPDQTGHAGEFLTTDGANPSWVATSGEATTASNGLTLVGDDVRLGGTLSVSTTIDTDTKQLSVIGATGSAGAGTLTVTNTSGLGLDVVSSNGPLIRAIASAGSGPVIIADGSSSSSTVVEITTANQTALAITSLDTGALPLSILAVPPSTSTVTTLARLWRNTQTNGANGIGGSIDMLVANDGPSGVTAAKLIAKLTSVTNGAETSSFIIRGIGTGTEQDLLTLSGTGASRFNMYGVGSFTGTPAYTLQVDASGNIIENAVTSLGGTVITASNGLTRTADDIALGGSLTASTTIDTLVDGRNLTIAGISTSSSLGILKINNTTQGLALNVASQGRGVIVTSANNHNGLAVTSTGSGTGVSGTSTANFGVGVLGQNDGGASSTGVWGIASSGNAIFAQTTTGLAFAAQANPSSTNTAVEVIKIDRRSSSTAVDGIGGAISFYTETSTGVNSSISNQVQSTWSTAANAARVSRFIVTGVNNAVTADLFTIEGAGKLRGNKYGVGTFTGTPAYTLQVDASGNLIENSTTSFGTGTVTATGGSLTANSIVLGAGGVDTKVVAGIVTDGTSTVTLGVNATTIGKLKMFGNTSGDVTVQPAAVAGTATVQTLPATTGTLVNRVTTANGVSASNTDGALSFTLGAITPATVNGNTFTTGSSTYTGTAAQTYTFPTTTATLARTDAAQTFTGIQTFSTAIAVGSGGTGVTSVTTTPTASAFAGWDANKNLFADNHVQGYTTTVTAAGTTVLTADSTYLQFFTGTTTQTVTLPSNAPVGMQFYVRNNSTGAVTINASGGGLVRIAGGGTRVIVTSLTANGTTAADWSSMYVGINITNGKVLAATNSLTLSGTDATTMTFPTTSATIARTDAANTFTGVQTFSTPIATGSVATMTATVGGGVPTPPNNTTTFLRGDGTFAAPSASGSGYVVDGGNTLAQSLDIGTLDANTLTFLTNSVTRASVTGGASTGGAWTFANVNALTNTVQDVATFTAATTGAATASYGQGFLFQGHTSTGVMSDMARTRTYWTTATNGSHEAAYSIMLGDAGGALAEVLKIDRAGSTAGAFTFCTVNGPVLTPSTFTTAQSFTVGNSSSALTLGGSSGKVTMSSSIDDDQSIGLNSSSNTVGSTASIRLGGLNSFIQTSGTRNYFFADYTFAPTSGTGVHNVIALSNTVNQTGGASGIFRSLYINPTITAGADVRAIETTNGKIIHTDTKAAGSGSLAGTLLDLAQTWNTSGNPTAVKLNVTNTASGTTANLMDLQVGGTSKFKVDKSGNVTANNLLSGTYTPTVTNSTNTDAAVTTTQAQYMRVGNVVTVSGRFTADPTLLATVTSFEMSLPISSNLGAVEDAAGVAFASGVAGMGAGIFAIAANDTAICQWVSSDTTSQTWNFSFTYEII